MNTCKVDLTKMDTYPRCVIPDTDLEVCLKVLRTLRNFYLDDDDQFDASKILALTAAHGVIHDAVEEVIYNEDREHYQSTSNVKEQS